MTSELPLSPVLVQRITRDYEEHLDTDLRLTPQQAQRRWGLDGPSCAVVLSFLVDAGVLQRTPDGRFVRRPSGA